MKRTGLDRRRLLSRYMEVCSAAHPSGRRWDQSWRHDVPFNPYLAGEVVHLSTLPVLMFP